MTKIVCAYIFSTSPNLCHRTTLLNTDVQNCYITLELITIRLRVGHPSVERPEVHHIFRKGRPTNFKLGIGTEHA